MRAAIALLLVLAGGAVALRAADEPALARARTAYNAAEYDAAIAAAGEARKLPASADAAAVVLARAYLERYRSQAQAADLAAAREALRGIVRARLSARDQVNLLVALGQALFFSDAFGSAAELFESALDRASALTPRERTLLLDWWATALDREAQLRPANHRTRAYVRIAERMEQELRTDPASAPANYWFPAATRGAGDLDRAWDAAVAAWVRLSVTPEVAPAVRADLDKLVTQALINERAKQRAPKEQVDTAAALRNQWEAIKAQWP